MSFSNLKRKSPSANREALAVDDFIQQAEHYARGENTQAKVVKLVPDKSAGKNDLSRLKPCTHTLSLQAKARLEVLAGQTGLSRSRLLRILLCDLPPEQILALTKNSKVR